MRKTFLGLFLLAATLTSGCLGDAPDQIIGTWRYFPIGPTHDITLDFKNNGQVFIYDNTTSVSDTGFYEMYMNGTNKMLRIRNTNISDPFVVLEGEFYILRIDYNILVFGTKDQGGGFEQRDLIKL